MKKLFILLMSTMPFLWSCTSESNAPQAPEGMQLLEEMNRSMNENVDAMPTPTNDIVEETQQDSDSPQSMLVGSWTTMETVSGQTLVFHPDNTYTSYSAGNEDTGKWSVEGNQLKLDDQSMSYEVKEDQLIIDGTTYEKG